MNKIEKFNQHMEKFLDESDFQIRYQENHSRVIKTKGGDLNITLSSLDPCIYYSVYTQFVDPKLARKTLNPLDMNSSGKWDFHIRRKNTDPETAAKRVITQIKKVLYKEDILKNPKKIEQFNISMRIFLRNYSSEINYFRYLLLTRQCGKLVVRLTRDTYNNDYIVDTEFKDIKTIDKSNLPDGVKKNGKWNFSRPKKNNDPQNFAKEVIAEILELL